MTTAVGSCAYVDISEANPDILCRIQRATAMRPSGRVTGFAALHQIIRTPARAPMPVPPTQYKGRAKMNFKQTYKTK